MELMIGTLRGLEILRSENIEPGVLAVCNVHIDPEVIVKHFVETLHLKKFDILVPDATHEDKPPSIASYYKKLFDLWYTKLPGIKIRFLESMLSCLLGAYAETEGIGYGAVAFSTILTDGSLEPLDILRIAHDGSTRTNLNIKTHYLQDLSSDPLWQEAFTASLNLCDTCKSCEYHKSCGGGHLAHRWSNEKRYNNVSVYCEDIKDIFHHIENQIEPEIAEALKS